MSPIINTITNTNDCIKRIMYQSILTVTNDKQTIII